MTLREHIKNGLGESYTKQLEDSLYWSISEFLDLVRENNSKGYSQLLEKIKLLLAEEELK